MSQKIKNTIIILVAAVLITSGGFVYSYYYQGEDIRISEKKLKKLEAEFTSPEELKMKIFKAKNEVAVIDSQLAERKFIIPKELTEKDFYDFVNNHYTDVATHTYTNIDYVQEKSEKIGDITIKFHLFKVNGVGRFQRVYQLLNAIEQSKELKKIVKAEMLEYTHVDKKGYPRYLVKFDLEVKAYFAATDRFTSTQYTENNLKHRELYNAFYPLIRNTIKPNVSDLPDIQNGELLFLFPEGAYIADTKGNTHVLKEGDKVYLGYLTSIDYKTQTVNFILNKGGIIHDYTLTISKNNKKGR